MKTVFLISRSRRLHEYKRQQLNALYIIYQVSGNQRRKETGKTDYLSSLVQKQLLLMYIAKDIIHLLLTLEDPDSEMIRT